MRIGIASAQQGRLAEPAAVKAVADAAEAIGYSSLWVADRLLFPVKPSSGYGGREGVAVPPEQARTLDPFTLMATLAARTCRVGIGASVLVAPWYPPAVLARLLTSLDVLSEGRLNVGLGTGWSKEEYEAVNRDFHRRGRHLDEVLDVLDAYWSDGDPVAPNLVAHEGELARIAPSRNELRPVQRPRPPVVLAGYTPAALDRVARRADGWAPAGYPIDAIGPAWNGVRDAAAGYGRDPDALQLVVRATLHVTDAPINGERGAYRGSLDQVIDDVIATRDAGADEIILHAGGDPSVDEALDVYARVTEAIGAMVAR